ncbi:p-loop containing nucleoside triphosphate hydrolase protein [Mycena kentingensis (nom. inval.)]|nr:p-loop containing nucleoside triphosphate hydrolase protein [Mycena kentingensis (nom. inval.)]
MVDCPICGQRVSTDINVHIDSCLAKDTNNAAGPGPASSAKAKGKSSQSPPKTIAPIFNTKRKHAEEPIDISSSPPEVEDSGPKASTSAAASEAQRPVKRSRRNVDDAAPLPEKLRPGDWSHFVGQESLVAIMTRGFTGSFILWGPSGCGKTTLARLVAKQSSSVFKELSATTASINDVKAIVEGAKASLSLTGRKTILFLDEIHRFNKSQQDIFLPSLEKGYLQLVGATTENPSFKLNGALLSRCRVFCLKPLEETHIKTIVSNALTQLLEDETTTRSSLPDKIMSSIVALAGGDARIAISLLEVSVKAPLDMSEDALKTTLRDSVAVSYDRSEDHYDYISALHKSIRASQPHAALYWLARMLNGGEDPMYIVRRLVVCSSEDIGLADPQALPLAIATLHACQNIGMPECRINLAHLVSYLSEAPKSTRAYEAFKRAEEAAAKDPYLPVPMSMRNAPTALMKELGYGESYRYNPDYAHPVCNVHLPNQLENAEFLRPPGDTRDKIWDEEALAEWERRNGPWVGRAGT